ncbi:MAG: AAA family ATPase, partial [Clostridiales bacterium]|nr:AAA family ATPase [Clostridiales bacterium]
MRLYNVLTDLGRESETQELMIGSGIIKVGGNTNVNHPVLLKRVSISLDAKNNELSISDTDSMPELYTLLLSQIPEINHSVIKQASEELVENYYHPLDRNNDSDFLKAFTHKLSSDSSFVGYDSEAKKTSAYLTLSMNSPLFFVRRKIDGTLKALETIASTIEETKEFPAPIGEIVSGGFVDVPKTTPQQTIEAQLASANGENPDILLSKAANKEQLEIAERIESYNAVLVQGPPGTGKTHTIANLIGHFLAQGKNVLVTSYTAKALSVLQEKLPESIQHLCVSVTGDDNSGMVRSIDGISEFMARHTSSEMKQQAEGAEQKRRYLLKQLDDIRKKLFLIRFAEFKPIVFGGNEYSPKDAAKFVHDNAAELS